jgi:hypothetical protein
MKKCLATLTAMIVSGSALAGNSQGLVTSHTVIASGFFLFAAGNQNSKIACSGNEWAVNISTPGGKAIMAEVLFAASQGKQVYVTGNGTCDAWGDRETVSVISILG